MQKIKENIEAVYQFNRKAVFAFLQRLTIILFITGRLGNKAVYKEFKTCEIKEEDT